VGHKRRKLAGPLAQRNQTRDLIFERQNHRCCICGVRTEGSARKSEPKAPTLEHVIPSAYVGGITSRANLVMTCVRCNNAGLAWKAWQKFCEAEALPVDWHLTQTTALNR
jgi:5-methylcytosine-specific restriction endonuclease McrA